MISMSHSKKRHQNVRAPSPFLYGSFLTASSAHSFGMSLTPQEVSLFPESPYFSRALLNSDLKKKHLRSPFLLRFQWTKGKYPKVEVPGVRQVGGADWFSPVCASMMLQATHSSSLAAHSLSAILFTATQSDCTTQKGKRTTPYCTVFCRLGNR